METLIILLALATVVVPALTEFAGRLKEANSPRTRLPFIDLFEAEGTEGAARSRIDSTT
jgi:hypothetical protein